MAGRYSPPVKRAATILFSLGGLAGLGACESSQRVSRDTLRVESMQPADLSPPEKAPAPDPPSLRRDDLSREHWAEQSYLLPIDGSRRLPEYSRTLSLTTETARQRGVFPDQTSATRLASDESVLPAVAEAVAWPFFAVADLIMITPRIALQDTGVLSPGASGRVDRRPAALARAGFLPPYGLPAIVAVPPSVLPPGEGPAQSEVPPGAWFFRDGQWYQGTRGMVFPPDAKPGDVIEFDGRTYRLPARPTPRPPRATERSIPSPPLAPVAPPTPPAQTPAPQPDLDQIPEGSWIFHDGVWQQGRKPRETKP